MDYPMWEPFVSNSIIIAVVAIVHVFVSHFAIGGGLYLVLAETFARRRNDPAQLAYVERHSRFFMLVTVVFGAVTGVGIWITIGLIQPVATLWLIRTFVWGFATEWVFFLVEIAAIIIYYYGWKKLSPRLHLIVGWIYFVTAWMSLAVINGIVAFMLTPGAWITTRNFWDGFFNPTYWPSLVFRTCICLILAGLYATVTCAREKDKVLKVRLLRFDGLLVLVSLALAAPAAYWYFRSLPAAYAGALVSGTTPFTAVQVMVVAAGVLFFLTLMGTILFPRHWGYVSAGVLLFCGLVSFGGFEWAREGLRKPFIIADFLYSNNVLAADAANLPVATALPVPYSTGDRGHDVFLAACRACHSRSDYKSLAKPLAGLDSAYIAALIPRLQYFRGKMPPFPGNGDDVNVLTSYLLAIRGSDPLVAKTDLTDNAKSKIAFDRRCGGCHSLDGPARPVGSTFKGLNLAEATEMVRGIGDVSAKMPPFTGSDEELRLTTLYLIGDSHAGGK